MIKHCGHCKTIFNLMPSFYSTRVLKDGTKTGSYLCRLCNTERQKKYRRTSVGAKNTYEAMVRSRKKFTDKSRARDRVANAVKAGKVIKPDRCSKCHTVKKLDGHHEDYSKPLDVLWLCRQCHADIHKKT